MKNRRWMFVFGGVFIGLALLTIGALKGIPWLSQEKERLKKDLSDQCWEVAPKIGALMDLEVLAWAQDLKRQTDPRGFARQDPATLRHELLKWRHIGRVEIQVGQSIFLSESGNIELLTEIPPLTPVMWDWKSELRDYRKGAQELLGDWGPDISLMAKSFPDLRQGGLVPILPRGQLGNGPFLLVVGRQNPATGSSGGWVVALISREAVQRGLESLAKRWLTPVMKTAWSMEDWNEEIQKSTVLPSPFGPLAARSFVPLHRLFNNGLNENFSIVVPSSRIEEIMAQRRRHILNGLIGSLLILIASVLYVFWKNVKRSEKISQMKTDFVATISHDLRTPLTAIAYISERLKSGRVESEEERQEFYQMLITESNELQELVNEVLDYSALSQGQLCLHLESRDMGQVAEEALLRLSSKLSKRQIHLKTDLPEGPLNILMDVKAIRHAMVNLIDNALKYSGQSKEIQIIVKAQEGGGLFSVKDYGIGIPAEEQSRIFEKFYRVEHALTQKTEGMGLGLAIVKELIEAHRGRVWVQSRLGEGSTFSLWLPFEGSPRPA